MQVTISGALVIVAKSGAERSQFEIWSAWAAGRAFYFKGGGTDGAMLDLGLREEACREPINIVFGLAWR